MRTLSKLILIAALATACSSKTKKEETAAPVKPATPAAPMATAETKVSAADVKPAAGLTCVKGKDSRVLEVRAKDKGCELAYTKNGQEAVVATGKSGHSHCDATREKISAKLKSSGYACN